MTHSEIKSERAKQRRRDLARATHAIEASRRIWPGKRVSLPCAIADLIREVRDETGMQAVQHFLGESAAKAQKRREAREAKGGVK